MDEVMQDEKTIASVVSRHRSPTFTKEEIKTLISLIDKHKTVLLNKSISNVACHAKEVTWLKIAKMFNSHGFKHNRNVDCLKMKWDNLKRDARKLSKNVMDVDHSEFDELTSQIVTMICEAENITSDTLLPKDFNEDIKDLETDEPKQSKDESFKLWNESEDKVINSLSGEENFKRKFINRSMNFTPQECSILLKCVRAEKKFVFCKDNNTKAVKVKNHAWAKITNSFNKQSPQKRSTKMLRTKFSNMKKLAKNNTYLLFNNSKINNYAKLDDDNEKIKSEPAFHIDEMENNDDEGVDSNNDDVPSSSGQNGENSYERVSPNIESNCIDDIPDPLSTTLNGGLDIGTINMESCNTVVNKEIVKLKLKLLNYELDNAKLERKRIEDAMQADAKANEARATETAIRLRTARLEAVAAAAKLPPNHPALLYTPEESRAQFYLNQYQHS